ncbi:MAG: IPTL-CTERM sorting domain-containing protein [Thermodesulfobacteriota bacterium]
MSNRNGYLASAVFFLLTCTFLLSATETGYTQGGSNCCFAHDGLGCDDQACQDAVCAIDSVCCEIGWDTKCADEALELCSNICIGEFHSIPTFNEWGLIVLAGALGLFSLFVVRKRYVLKAK